MLVKEEPLTARESAQATCVLVSYIMSSFLQDSSIAMSLPVKISW